MDKKERGRKNRGAHIIGWLIEGIAVLMFIGAAILAAWDGVRSGFDGRPWNWRYFINFFTSPSFSPNTGDTASEDRAMSIF